MYIHPLRKILHTIGFDITRYRPIPDRLEWIRSLNIKSVIDVGANTGQFATLLRSYLPEAYIYSYEPVREIFKELLQTMEGDKRFSAFNVALGETNKSISIHRSSYSPTSSFLSMEKLHTELLGHAHDLEDEMVTVQKMDDLFFDPQKLQKEILIKIDTEGYERAVIEGGRNTLSKAKILIIENSYVLRYTDQILFDEMYSLVSSLGLSYAGALSQKLNPHTGEILFEDSLFVHH